MSEDAPRSQLEGRICIVTGGGSGIGRATAVEMARRGARAIVVADINVDAGTDTAVAVREHGAAATAVPCDISSESDVRRLMATAAETFGGSTSSTTTPASSTPNSRIACGSI